PCEHSCPDAHGDEGLHDPQKVALFAVSVHVVPHMVCSIGQTPPAPLHTPAMQSAPLEQLAFVIQGIRALQLPLMHPWPAEQTVPQAPQFCELFSTSTQLLLHILLGKL